MTLTPEANTELTVVAAGEGIHENGGDSARAFEGPNTGPVVIRVINDKIAIKHRSFVVRIVGELNASSIRHFNVSLLGGVKSYRCPQG